MRHIEFDIIDDEVEAGIRQVVAGGRCISGPIFVDDVFTAVGVAGGAQPTRLRVVEIRAYGQLLNQLDAVVTAQLLLIGEGGGCCSARCTLYGDVSAD